MFKQKPKILTTIRRVLLLAILAIAMAGSFGVFFGGSETANAATNDTINFQARLLTAAGRVVPDGLYNIEFKLYNAASSSGSSQGSCAGDSACVWTETRTVANRVRVVNGYLTVNLGSVTAFGSVNWDQEHWLGMNVGGTTGPSWDGEMTPRLKLTAVPYAFRAGSLVGGSGSNVTILDAGTPSGSNTIHLPAESGTLCIQSSVNCGFAVASGSASYIQNQFSGVQTSSQFWISGTGRAATALQAPLFDAASAGALAIGTTNATAINLNQDTTVASGKALTVAGGATSLTGATTGVALTVSNSTSTGDIMVLKDNSTTVMTVADGGGVTFTSSVNSSTALQVQNAAGGNVLSVNTTGSGATLTVGRSGASGHAGAVISGIYQGASSTSQGFTFSGGVPAGSSIVGSLTLSASATTTVTITDTAGNTYSVDASSASASVTTSYIFSSNITNAISAGHTLTIQIASGTGRWLVTANAFGNLLTPALDKTSTNTANSASMTTGTSATTTTANELVFATFGFGSGRTFTAGAGFTGIAQISTSAGSNDRSTGNQWKYVTSTGTQEGTATISSAGVYSAALATYRSTNPSLGGSAGSVQLSDGTSSNNFVTLGTNSLSTGRTILLPDESGTLCIQGSSSCVGLQQAYNASTGGTTPEIKLDGTRAGVDIQDADTTVGAVASLFAVRASNASALGNAMFQIQGSGAATFKNAANSTTAFSIQDASSNSMFNVDTSNGRVGIGGVATFSKFEVIGGDAAIYNNGGNPRLVLGDSTAAGQNGYLQWDSTNNYFRIESVGTNGLKINDNYVAIGNIFPSQPLIVGNGSTPLLQVNTTGDVFTKTSTNSTTAFQVQNATGIGVLTVDTQNSRVGIGNSSPTVHLDVGPGSLGSGQVVQIRVGDFLIQSEGGAANGLTAMTSRGSNGNLTLDGASGAALYLSPFTTNNSYLAAGGGNVRVGDQTTPTAKLDVAGSVKVTGALTQSGGAISLTGSTSSSISTASGTLTLQSVNSSNNIVINGSSGTMTLNTGSSGTITVGSANTATVNIGAQTNNARTINIGNPAATSQAQNVNIGATAGTGAVAIKSGTGGITLTSNGSTIVGSATDSDTAFQVQNAASNGIFTVGTSSNQISVGSTAQSVDLKMTGDMTWGTSITSPQGFESTTFVPTTPGTWSTGGTANWTRTTAEAQAGSASAVSANVADSQNSWLDLNYTYPSDGVISFYWKVSSESGWDYLMFCVDNDANCTLAGGGEYGAISGNTAWAKVSVPVSAGAHSFRWAYEKDNATTEGSDIGWIDNVQFTSGSVAGTVSGDSLSFLASDTITFSTVANPSALTVDSNGRVGINTTTPSEALTVVGNFNVADATTATKAYRFRTSGSALDFEGGGANLYLSTWSGANFTGTQYAALILYSSQSRMDVKSAYTYFNPDTDAVSTVDINTPGTGTQDILRFAQAGTVIGYVRSNGSGLLTYQTFTGAHPAWTDEQIDYGMVVSMTGNNRSRDPSNPSSEPYYGIKKSAQANDPAVLGAYFGGPARGPWSFEDSDSVMAVGNGVMWVSDEGGDITRGDDFISSSLPGYAMKDGRQFAESNVIAKASEDVDWSAVTQTVGGHKVKMISVIYAPYTRLNAAGLAMGLASGGIVSNDITFNGLALFNGTVRFKSDVSFEGHIKVGDNTAGTLKIPAGQTSATVTFSKSYDKPPKVTTGISEFVDVAVDGKSNNGFTVRIPTPRASDTYIDWTAFEAP